MVLVSEQSAIDAYPYESDWSRIEISEENRGKKSSDIRDRADHPDCCSCGSVTKNLCWDCPPGWKCPIAMRRG